MFLRQHCRILAVIFMILQPWTIYKIAAKAPLLGFVYNNCTNNNALTYSATTGGTLFWQETQYNSRGVSAGNMNDSYIIKCTVTFVGEPQNTNAQYEQFLGIYFRQWQLDSSIAATRVNQIKNYNIASNYTFELTPYYDAYQTINMTCGSNCPTGCMILHDPLGPTPTYCGKDILAGTEYTNIWTTDTVTMDFYILGGYFPENITNGTDYGPIQAVDPPSVNIIFDYTSFYQGPCTDTSTEFYCNSTGRCIDINLKCDAIGAWNCGIPQKGTSSSQPDDITYCTSSTSTVTVGITIPQLLGICIGAILGAALLTIMCLCLFWRPGLLVWMLARLRQGCPKCAAQCNKPWTHGEGKCLDCFRSGEDNSSKFKKGFGGFNPYFHGDGMHFREGR